MIIHLFNCIYQGTKHILGLGRTKIAYLGGPEGSRISKEKFKGFKKALDEAGIEVRDHYLTGGRYHFQTGYQAAMEFMRLPNPPDAIVCGNDVLAIGCVKYLTHNGFKVPEDVAVIGMDGIQLSYIYDPSISTIAMPIQEMCQASVDLLINKIDKPRSKNKQIIYNTSLVVRRSTEKNAPLILDL